MEQTNQLTPERLEDSISAETYHKLPGVSNSKLKDFIDDPRLYYYKHLSGKYRPKPKDHFDFGSAVHEVALLGDKSNIVVIPDEVLSTSGSRAGGKWKDFAAANAGKILLKQNDYDAVMRCVDALYADPMAGQLLREPGVCEKMFQADFPDLQFTLRCRPDKLIENLVVDLKTTSSTRPEKFVRSIIDFSYANQEYFYRKVLTECGIQVKAFVFIAVSVDEPHTVDCYSLRPEWLAIAEDEVEGALSSLARRTIENDWDSDSCGDIIRLAPPPYYLNRKRDYQV